MWKVENCLPTIEDLNLDGVGASDAMCKCSDVRAVKWIFLCHALCVLAPI